MNIACWLWALMLGLLIASLLPRSSNKRMEAIRERTVPDHFPGLEMIAGMNEPARNALYQCGLNTYEKIAREQIECFKKILIRNKIEIDVKTVRTWPRQAQLLSENRIQEWKEFCQSAHLETPPLDQQIYPEIKSSNVKKSKNKLFHIILILILLLLTTFAFIWRSQSNCNVCLPPPIVKCPVVDPQPPVVTTIKLVIHEATLFDFNDYRVREEGTAYLGYLIAQEFGSAPYSTIKIKSISGHSDPIGTAEYNEKLSFNRAKAISDTLTNMGFQLDESVPITGKGETVPIPEINSFCEKKYGKSSGRSTNALRRCFAPLRRVEITLEH